MAKWKSEDDDTLDVSLVDRVEVIDANGRSYVNLDVEEVELQLQDGNRTLKVFIK